MSIQIAGGAALIVGWLASGVLAYFVGRMNHRRLTHSWTRGRRCEEVFLCCFGPFALICNVLRIVPRDPAEQVKW